MIWVISRRPQDGGNAGLALRGLLPHFLRAGLGDGPSELLSKTRFGEDASD